VSAVSADSVDPRVSHHDKGLQSTEARHRLASVGREVLELLQFQARKVRAHAAQQLRQPALSVIALFALVVRLRCQVGAATQRECGDTIQPSCASTSASSTVTSSVARCATPLRELVCSLRGPWVPSHTLQSRFPSSRSGQNT
jgi:hypothetical protein